jgi:hypothetical protein
MTEQQALELIRSSSPYVNAQGDVQAAWKRYEDANPIEARALREFIHDVQTGIVGTNLASSLTPTQWRTKWAQGWAGLFTATPTAPAPAPEPPPVPPPAPAPVPVPSKPFLGAMVIVAGNIDPELLRAAGVSKVCVELNDANLADFATARWNGFERGHFVVSRGNDGDTIASLLAQAPPRWFAVVDTESHKTDMGGQLAWTETLYAALRSKLGPSFPLFNITFGVHGSPAVINHDAFRRHNITPIFEAYDGSGFSTGVERTALKAVHEGWDPPQICLGDKSLANDSGWVRRLWAEGRLGSCWLWQPDGGEAQDALRSGTVKFFG